jgi:prevent-host-death family protein
MTENRKRMGIRELRDNLTATIRRVRAGETIEITHHHEPVAVLAPVRRDRLAALVQAGEATPGVPLERPIRRFRATTGITASEALEEDRAAER